MVKNRICRFNQVRPGRSLCECISHLVVVSLCCASHKRLHILLSLKKGPHCELDSIYNLHINNLDRGTSTLQSYHISYIRLFHCYSVRSFVLPKTIGFYQCTNLGRCPIKTGSALIYVYRRKPNCSTQDLMGPSFSGYSGKSAIGLPS